MTKAEAKVLVGVLVAAYPHQAIEQETLDLYVALLTDLDAAQATAAVKRLICLQARWRPTIAEIREEVVEPALALPSPAAAWAEVKAAIAKHGVPYPGQMDSWRRPSWSCTLVAEAVKAIGYTEIATAEIEGVARAHFLQAYSSMREETVRAAQLPPDLKRQPAALPIESAPALLKTIADVLPVVADARLPEGQALLVRPTRPLSQGEIRRIDHGSHQGNTRNEREGEHQHG